MDSEGNSGTDAAVSSDGGPRSLGRYVMFQAIASGGMATMHLGRSRGAGGFARTVAIKRMHRECATNAEFVAMFLDEARLAARINHPNVVATLDVVMQGTELFLVMDYVHGEALAGLMEGASKLEQGRAPPEITSAIMFQALMGLHAAHEATNEAGRDLELVHRDVSPQNVLVGVDGVARMVDFGVAKATARIHSTREGKLKGKLSYMAPEQIADGEVDRRSDIFSAGIILWEALTGRRLFGGGTSNEIIGRILKTEVEPPTRIVPELPEAVDDVLLCALARDPEIRFATGRAMAMALQSALPGAPTPVVGDWVGEVASEALSERAKLVAEMEIASPQPSKLPDLATVSLMLDENAASTLRDQLRAAGVGTDTLSTGDLDVTVDDDADAMPPTPLVRPDIIQATVAGRALAASGEQTGAEPSTTPQGAFDIDPSTRPQALADGAASAGEPSTVPRRKPGEPEGAPAPTRLPSLKATRVSGTTDAGGEADGPAPTGRQSPEALRSVLQMTKLSGQSDAPTGAVSPSAPPPLAATRLSAAAASPSSEPPLGATRASATPATTPGLGPHSSTVDLQGAAAISDEAPPARRGGDTRVSWPVDPNAEIDEGAPPQAVEGGTTKPGLGTPLEGTQGAPHPRGGPTLISTSAAASTSAAGHTPYSSNGASSVAVEMAAPLSAADAAAPSTGRSRRLAAAIVLALVATVAVAAVLILSLRNRGAPAPPPEPSSSPAPMATTARSEPPPEPSATEPTSTEAPTPSASSTASAPAMGEGHLPTRPTSTAVVPTPPATTPPPKSCNPPYVIRPDGVKVFKPECF